MSNEHTNRHPVGRSYYIALALSLCALGVSGYLYSTGRGAPRPQQDQPVIATEDLPVSVQQPREHPHDAAQKPEKPTLPPPTESEPQKLQVQRPLEGKILCGHAVECLSYNETTRDWRTHAGIDIGAEAGTAVNCAADGEVYTVYDDEKLGTTVVIRHAGGYVTTYASLAQQTEVKPGQTVTMGQKLGCVGSTALMESALGDHLHFCVTKDDVPVDPEKFFAGQ